MNRFSSSILLRWRRPQIILGILCSLPLATAATPDLPSCDVWMLACHYTASNREASYNINRVVIHKTQGGTAAGSASWFANCASGGSAHYNFDKSNGHCYQSVREKDVAWHAGNTSYNNSSIGIEHSGWVNNNDTSTACYNESAVETRSCISYYAVPNNRTYIIGHSQVPGCSGYGGGTNCHTDPGPHWNWNYYMSQLNGFQVGGAILVRYNQLGGAGGILGPATTNELTCPDGVGKFNHFQNNGSIYWTQATGAWEVRGDIRTKWSQIGWETGICGYPTTGEATCPDGVGKFNHFNKGSSIYWTPGTGAQQVGGAIRAKWEALGWEGGICGYPRTSETGTPNGLGRFNHFSKNNASIYWSAATGAWSVQGLIKDKWASLGWEASSLGFPTSDEYSVGADRRSNFQGGTITWHAADGTVTVP